MADDLLAFAKFVDMPALWTWSQVIVYEKDKPKENGNNSYSHLASFENCQVYLPRFLNWIYACVFC